MYVGRAISIRLPRWLLRVISGHIKLNTVFGASQKNSVFFCSGNLQVPYYPKLSLSLSLSLSLKKSLRLPYSTSLKQPLGELCQESRDGSASDQEDRPCPPDAKGNGKLMLVHVSTVTTEYTGIE